MVPPLLARPAWRGLPVGPPGRRGRAPLIEPLVSQTLSRSQSRLRSKFKHPLAIVVVQLCAVDKLVAARLAHSRREEDHRETTRARGQAMQGGTIGPAHADLHRVASRLFRTPEPSIVAQVLLALSTTDFKHAQNKRQEYASTRVGHDIPQTSSTSDEALDLVAGPSQPDGVHPEDGPNSRHRQKDSAHIHHPHPLCDAATPAVLCLFLSTGRIPLFPDRTHERRQFFQLVGRMEWHLPRLARLIVTGPHINREGPR